MKNITLTIALLTMSLTASAATINGGYIACLTEPLFKQYIRALNINDDQARAYLKNNGCLNLRPGTQVTLLDSSWGTAMIRLYVNDLAVEMWTNIENVNN